MESLCATSSSLLSCLFSPSFPFFPFFSPSFCAVDSFQRIRVISRDKESCTRERTSDMMKVFRNYDPTIHPFERAREYTRALNATKLERVFAKPFVGALNGHKDTIYTISSNPTNMKMVASGSCDGGSCSLLVYTHLFTRCNANIVDIMDSYPLEIRVWDISTRYVLFTNNHILSPNRRYRCCTEPYTLIGLAVICCGLFQWHMMDSFDRL
jgi:WD40 repeat protein